MCGIGGIINLSKKSIDPSDLQLLIDELKERGPDNKGIWIHENVGFIHRRLSIIDVSDAGNQPMQYNNITITFNGEIYNFKQLREELISKGLFFSTHSDTEVILKGYSIWGIDKLLDKLDGMFAFCLFDIDLSQIFLCRDRIGKKPLYYFKNDERLIFSSEIRSIPKLEKKLTINYKSIDYYLTELSMPQPNTIWNEVFQLEPGSFFEINLNSNLSKKTKYHKYKSERIKNVSEEDVLVELEKKITDAVLKRTISDVPIGCFLSGGVDSGLVVSTLAKNSKERVKTFSIGFNDKEYNELELANLVAKKYNTDHTEIIVKPNNISDMLIDLLGYIAEPFADPSILPTYIVSKEISKYVKVALSGDGGDEVFGGYGNYLTSYKAEQFFENNPNELTREIKVAINKINSTIGLENKHYGLYNSFLKMDGAGKLNRFMGFSIEEKKMLYKPALEKNYFFTSDYLNEIWKNNNISNSLTDTLFLSSLETRLLNGYLVKVDRMSMKNSLEVRSPFLDTELINYSFTIDTNLVFGNGSATKYLLKKIVEKNYDPEIFNRKKKGFELPIKKWLKSDLTEIVYDVLLSKKSRDRGLFNENYIEKIISDHMNKGIDNTYKIWALLCLELWFQINDL